MNSTISPRTYRAMYRLLDMVNPIDSDCGKLCGAVCCTCTYEPEDFEFSAEGDCNADEYMGLFLLPGEEKIHFEDTSEDAVHGEMEGDWFKWGYVMAEDYEYPESWTGKVYVMQCKDAPVCPREKRPIQCRTFPLAPHIDEDGIFHLIRFSDELPYACPLIDEDMPLNEDFAKATFTVWKHLIKDPLIYDLVEMDSEIRIEEGQEITIVI